MKHQIATWITEGQVVTVRTLEPPETAAYLGKIVRQDDLGITMVLGSGSLTKEIALTWHSITLVRPEP